MHDSFPKKALFWGFVLAFVGLAAVPSAILVDKFQEYADFLTAWEPSTMRSRSSKFIPHRGGLEENGGPELHFVEFSLKAPRSKKVLLAGDFNGWRPENLPLVQAGKAGWQILVPLPAGKYQYLFQVDGQWVKDPDCRAEGRRGDLITCIRQVP